MSRSHMKTLGAYYTPPDIAEALADWAIESASDKVLDPSYGGCSFFSAAIQKLITLGSSRPYSQLYGTDIDPKAINSLRQLPGFNERTGQIQTGVDFLVLRPSRLQKWRVDAILANPPYNRHHHLRKDQVNAAQAAMTAIGLRLPRTSSYWAYFLLHSLAFLAPGGRIAMVLPPAYLTVDYAAPVREIVSKQFEKSESILYRRRLFPKAIEATVVVLGSGWRGLNNEHSRQRHPRGKRVSKPVQNKFTISHGVSPERDRHFVVFQGGSSQELPTAVNSIFSSGRVTTLGDLASVKIGVVTGAKHFFVLSRSEIARRQIPKSNLLPIVCRATYIRSLEFVADDYRSIHSSDLPCSLLAINSNRLPNSLKTYLECEDGVRASRAYKCASRTPWYCIRHLEVPDAFIPCFHYVQPRLVLNRAGVLCTNTIHRINWRHKIPVWRQRMISLSLLTSFSALIAESNGRYFGDGVLKLEPSDVSSLPVVLPDLDRRTVNSYFRKASSAIAESNWSSATDLANEAVLRIGLGSSRKSIADLQRAANMRRSIRLPSTNE